MRIGITIGDPAGIGPEITIKAIAAMEESDASYIAFGDMTILERAMEYPGMPRIDLRPISRIEDAINGRRLLNVFDMHNLDMKNFHEGKESIQCGKASYEYIAESIKHALSGKIDAVCTAPINKVALHMANVPYIGHTEIFAALTNSVDPLTMFQVENMRIFFLTRHVALRQACDMVTYDRLMDYAIRCSRALHQLGIDKGTMAIAGLNPHSGDHGLFGNEEDAIVKAVLDLRQMGFDVTGPVSADSVFHQALQGKYTSVLSLYHDQGHIAAKTYNFDKTISLTLGMPILRTSVDHGTAMDIAGKGIANETGMVEALKAAYIYAPSFRKDKHC